MRDFAVPVDIHDPDAIDLCGTGGDHAGTFNISTTVAFLVVVPAALNPWMLRLAGTLIAEPVYFFFSILALWLLEREVTRSRTVAGTAAALAVTLLRSAGITLPGAIQARRDNDVLRLSGPEADGD